MTVTATAVSCFGNDQMWPPGFRFHPTDEELVLYYLKRKICKRKLKLDIIRETDVYKWDPEELPAQSILKSGDRQWFFFTPRERKYPNGARSNRATEHGYWKATGKDRAVTCNSRTVGVKKTLVFYRGRAPSGERTDWVMHEYTLDEEELKRCQNVKEYYALYKLYQKSGPGPKNGEQYGAPFKEEEWADVEYTGNPVDTITLEKPPIEANSDDNEKLNYQVQSLLNDDEEFVRQLIDEPVLPLPQAHFGYVLPQAVSVGETQSTLLDPSVRDVHFPEPHVVFHDQTSFEISQSPTSQLKLHKSPEVTSVPAHFEQGLQLSEEDYLEIDDIGSSKLLNSNVVEPPENGQQFNELDEPSELDLYHEPVMYLQDNGPIDQGTAPFYENMINHVSYPLESQSNISPIDQQLQPQSTINLMEQQLQHQSNINLMDQQLQHQSNAFGGNQQLQSQFNVVGDNQYLQHQSNAFGDNQQSQSQLNVVGDNLLLQPQLNAFGDNQQSQSQLNVVGDNLLLQAQLNAFGDNQQSQSQFNVVGDNQLLQPQLNALDSNMLYQVGYQSPSLSNINLMDQQWISHSTADQVDDQLQFQSVGNELDQHLHMDQMNGSLRMHDQSANVFTASGSNLGSVAPTSGLVDNGINPNQGDKSGGGGGSRFSSAMWSLVESIPTTPASASEGPLGNRAFEGMSSYSRLRLNATITDISAVNGAATAKRSRGFFFISILGASCAVLWFLIGRVGI